MNCTRCEELMSDYLERALEETERRTMDLHLQRCPDCSQLLAGMAQVLQWSKTFPVHEAPSRLEARIIANTALMSCSRCEELMSDFMEGVLEQVDRSAFESHVRSCEACSDLFGGMGRVVEWGKTFPVYEAPAWLPSRIIANTPRIERERWIDTIAAAWKWVLDPRAAMGLFTATLVLGWLAGLAGFSPDWRTVVSDPTAIYYEAQGAVNRAYDHAVRRYYRSPLVTEIRTRIEQLREIS